MRGGGGWAVCLAWLRFSATHATAGPDLTRYFLFSLFIFCVACSTVCPRPAPVLLVF